MRAYSKNALESWGQEQCGLHNVDFTYALATETDFQIVEHVLQI